MTDLHADLARTRADYESFKARGLKLDMTRGKPSPEQLSLSDAMLLPQGNRDTTTAAGEDARNYGGASRACPRCGPCSARRWACRPTRSCSATTPASP